MKHTEKFLRQRKFALMLPVLVLPFLTLLFWTLGGGQGVPAQAQAAPAGLNLQLPDANFGTREVWDKLSLYDLAAADSARYREARESDPYFDLVTFETKAQITPDTSARSKLIETFKQKNRYPDPNEKRVTDKLEQLYAEINKSAADPITTAPQTTKGKPAGNRQSVIYDQTPADPQFTSDVDRLEQMMELIHSSGEADPEMQQIENVLEKILDIQHPQRVQEKLKAQSIQPRQAYTVESLESNTLITSFTPDTILSPGADSVANISTPFFHRATPNGFFGLDDENPTSESQTEKAIQAIIHDTQEVVAGATVRMRLLHDVTINGQVIHKDQFIYGTCNISGERLTIDITSIRAGNTLLPISLVVYDLDGLEGIYIPGAITRDAAKQAGDNALQNLQWMSLDPSITQQAASAGIEAAKGLLSKKAKLIKVTVKAGYQILLVDKR